MNADNPYAAPKMVEPPAVDAATGAAIWRNGKLLVIGPDQVLPARCVKCNEAADAYPFRRTLVWYPRWTYLGLLGGLIPFVVIAIVMQKKLTGVFALCELHRRHRRRAILIGWLGSLAGMAIIIGGASSRDLAALGVMSGIVTILISVFYGLFASRIVWPQRIRDQRAWVNGVCPQYLEGLPEYGM